MTESSAPKPPSPLWKWTKRIGCTLLLLTFACCLFTCSGSWWLKDTMRNKNKEELDRIHAEGLHDGDLEIMFARADPAFRQRFTLKDLQAKVLERPGLFERENFIGATLEKRTIDGVVFVKITSRPDFALIPSDWIIVFKIVDGVYVFVGITPGMDELVPPEFRWAPRQGGGGRLFWD